ncbi:MAG: hypothetical protein FJZ56_05260 [Chlamydiae bacterium]|nr:hypothetical protein [Chlamydiota bacterium]
MKQKSILLVGVLLAGSYVAYNLLTKTMPKKVIGKTEEVEVSGSFMSADASSNNIPSWAESIFRKNWIV